MIGLKIVLQFDPDDQEAAVTEQVYARIPGAGWQFGNAYESVDKGDVEGDLLASLAADYAVNEPPGA